MKRAALLLLLFGSLSAFSQQYDVLIRNGRVVDGAGNPWTYADIGILGDRIAFVGHADPAVAAKRIIDASGLVVAPGFIDMLGQSGVRLLIEPQAVSKLTQGITTEITGEGDSVAPLDDRLAKELTEYYQQQKLTIDWRTLGEYFDRLDKQGAGINLATFVGATQVRRVVIGDADRAPTAEQLREMQGMVGDAMYDGALGLSSSLIYAPAFYAKTDELIALAKEAAGAGGIYASHIRNEADSELQALEEAFRISREAGLPLEIWHLKIAGRQNWGKMRPVLDSIERARAAGVDVTADQYPYVASSTSLSTVIPPKYHDGGTDAMLRRLKDPQQRASIRKDLETLHPEYENMWLGSGGPDGILITSVNDPALRKYQGKTVAQIAEGEHKHPLDALMDLVIADRNNVGAAYFEMNESDVRLAMQQPWVAVNNDSSATSPSGSFGTEHPHPRAYGSFPRILGKYVREEHVLRLEDAVRKFTSLPAQRVKLTDRGLLRTGYFADVTIFDPDAVHDVATFEDPNRVSVGIEYVLVNGVLALEHGKVTGQLGGRPLRGPGWPGHATAPGGLPSRPRLEGIVTDDGGWPVPRVKVTLTDASGRVVGDATTNKAGRYQIFTAEPCDGCSLHAERDGFTSAGSTVAHFNGANPLWFSFVLRPESGAPRNDQ